MNRLLSKSAEYHGIKLITLKQAVARGAIPCKVAPDSCWRSVADEDVVKWQADELAHLSGVKTGKKHLAIIEQNQP